METKQDKLKAVLCKAKKVAREYRTLTGKPLGITGEIAEFEAMQKLAGVRLEEARKPGYDAIEQTGRRRKLQIKGRCIQPGQKMGEQRVPSINLNGTFHAVVLVLLDEHFNAFEIYEADRKRVEAELKGKKRRDLSLSKFKSIGKKVWPRTPARPR